MTERGYIEIDLNRILREWATENLIPFKSNRLVLSDCHVTITGMAVFTWTLSDEEPKEVRDDKSSV